MSVSVVDLATATSIAKSQITFLQSGPVAIRYR